MTRESTLEAVSQRQSLPHFVHDACGLLVKLADDQWRLNDVSDGNNVLDWRPVALAQPEMLFGAKSYVISLIKTRSPSHAQNSFTNIRDILLKSVEENASQMDLVFMAKYFDELRAGGSEWRFHYVRAWYDWCERNYMSGFNSDALFSLRNYRIKGNPKGQAVLSLDPDEGPLDELEQSALRNALKRDTGPILERLLLWLLLTFGSNTLNMTLLREVDYEVQHPGAFGIGALCALKIPRIKKGLPSRAEFKERSLTNDLAVLVEELIETNRRFEFGEGIARPLFIRPTPRGAWLNGPLREYAHHYEPWELGLLLQRYVRKLRVISPRTGKPLKITVRRLRYTFAIKMVRRGATPNELAELLDHSDLQNVLVYYKNTSTVIENLDKALAVTYGPIIRAFFGEFIWDKESPTDRLTFIDLNEAMDFGACGASFACHLAPPLTCYTCDRFLAFKDGPHEKVLDALIRQRDQFIEDSRPNLAMQLDDVIMACAEIVAKIKA